LCLAELRGGITAFCPGGGIAVGGKRVEDPKTAQRLLEKASSKRPVPLLIYRNGQNLYLALQP